MSIKDMARFPIQDPEGWQQDSLSRFFSACEHNTRLSFDRYQVQWHLFNDIQEAMDAFANHNSDLDQAPGTETALPLLLFARAHAAYLGALRLTTAVSFVEAYPLMRSALENALYAFYFKKEPSQAELWMNRHSGEVGRKAARKASRIDTMLQCLQEQNFELGWRANNIYERSIDLGAHPNYWGVVGPLMDDEASDMPHSPVLGSDGYYYQTSLSYVASAGLVVLELICETFPGRAKELDLLLRTYQLILRHQAIQDVRKSKGLI